MDNRKIGNEFEKELCEILQGKGFWVYNCPSTISGQPTDIICVGKKGISVLIDAKVISTNRGFPFSRIESNQETSMMLFKKVTGRAGWFAFKLPDGDIRFITLDGLLAYWEIRCKSYAK